MACDSFPETGGCVSPKSTTAVGCLSHRVSFSNSFAELDTQTDGGADMNDSEFDFSMAISNLSSISEGTMLSADELFCNGKLLPLHISPPYGCMDAQVPESIHKEDVASLNSTDRQFFENDKQSSAVHEPSAVLFSSGPLESGCFAPPSPETPKCSVILRDLFGANKGQMNSIRESSGKLMTTSKVWKTLVRGMIAAGKKGAVRSTISEESLKVSLPAGSDLKASNTSSSHAAAPLSVVIPSRTPSPGSCEKQHCLANREVPVPILERSVATSADDWHVVPVRKRATSYRSVSMPNSRCTSPDRGNNAQKSFPKACEKLPFTATGKVNSGKIIMKNLERCSTNQKIPVKCQQEHGNAFQQREYWRAPERVSSYTSNVRVTPLLSVPISVSPSSRNNKLAKGRFSSFKELFSPKKESGESKKDTES